VIGDLFQLLSLSRELFQRIVNRETKRERVEERRSSWRNRILALVFVLAPVKLDSEAWSQQQSFEKAAGENYLRETSSAKEVSPLGQR
jgi:hypothetical protein